MLKKTKAKLRGFTLIELLVVIAIISLLSSIVFTSLNDSRAKARDARRMSDIGEINKAIQLYMVDHNGNPPDLGNPDCLNINNTILTTCFADSNGGAAWNNLRNALLIYIDINKTIDPCPNCTASNSLISKVYAANSNFKYVYQAPAEVSRVLAEKGISLKNLLASGVESYGVYANKLEKKSGTFGFGPTVTNVIVNPPTTYICSDGKDNDKDGLKDLEDPGCNSKTDNDETDPQSLFACSDGIDNDEDGSKDLEDPDCIDEKDDSEAESSYACSDKNDNDGDGLIDQKDPGCWKDILKSEESYDPKGDSEVNPQCYDGKDNDGDKTADYEGTKDFPKDKECLGDPNNNSESK